MIELNNIIPGVNFVITSTKHYVPVVTLSSNDNLKFLEKIKQGFKITISWNKCRSEITTQPKKNNLHYLIDLTFRNINRLFVLAFKKGNVILKEVLFKNIIYHWKKSKILVH